jgi:hypothetical protein
MRPGIVTMRLRKAEGRENPEAAMAATRKAVRASWRAIAEQARDRAEADLRAPDCPRPALESAPVVKHATLPDWAGRAYGRQPSREPAAWEWEKPVTPFGIR